MKRLVALIPCLTLVACGGAADITSDEPFQITCTWTEGDESGDETWFIDPKLDVAVLDPMDNKIEEVEFPVRKVTPKRIVLGNEWGRQLIEEDSSLGDWIRTEVSINRITGELSFKKFGINASTSVTPTTVAAGWKGEKQKLAFVYDCQKPSRK